jgi:hypothetical protein
MTLGPYEMQHAEAMLYMKLKFVYSVIGLILGLVSMVAGSVLFLHGVSGSTSWSASLLGLQSTVTDAAPGSVLFIVGLFIVWATKYKVITKYHPITAHPESPKAASFDPPRVEPDRPAGNRRPHDPRSSAVRSAAPGRPITEQASPPQDRPQRPDLSRHLPPFSGGGTASR